MSMGHEAMQAPQYMQIPLLTTSVTRLPKIFSFFGRGFHPSPSTLDFNGVSAGASVGGLAVGTAPGTDFTAGVELVGGGTGLAGATGGFDMGLSSPSLRPGPLPG